MKQALCGKTALLTGGGSGIGRATAMALSAAGARVAIGDIVADRGKETVLQIVAAGGDAVAFAVDVSDAASVTGFFDQTLDRFGRLDIGVNNAGVGAGLKNFEDLDEEAFDRTIAINLKGVWLCMKHEIAIFKASGGGAIVNTASALGLVGGALSADYVASKHGVIGLTRTAAIEHSANGIRVNAVCPGVIRTPLIEAAQLPDEQLSALTRLHPIGRLGTPQEVAEAIVWLASPAASFVTGAAVAVDGAWTAQ